MADGPMMMVGLLTFLDPPRPDTKETLERAMMQGVVVKVHSHAPAQSPLRTCTSYMHIMHKCIMHKYTAHDRARLPVSPPCDLTIHTDGR